MRKNFIKLVFLSMLFTSTTAVAEYAGKGGMTAYKVTAEVYEYHYKNGFTGVDAIGWDPNLQFAWSRAGAALTCNVKFDKKAVLSQMSKKYGNTPFIHDLNGVGFHHAHSKRVDNFCTEQRIQELKVVLPKLELGDFPENF